MKAFSFQPKSLELLFLLSSTPHYTKDFNGLRSRLAHETEGFPRAAPVPDWPGALAPEWSTFSWEQEPWAEQTPAEQWMHDDQMVLYCCKTFVHVLNMETLPGQFYHNIKSDKLYAHIINLPPPY